MSPSLGPRSIGGVTAWWWCLLVITLITLILGITDQCARARSECAADGSAFKATSGLVADDPADCGPAEAAEDCASL